MRRECPTIAPYIIIPIEVVVIRTSTIFTSFNYGSAVASNQICHLTTHQPSLTAQIEFCTVPFKMNQVETTTVHRLLPWITKRRWQTYDSQQTKCRSLVLTRIVLFLKFIILPIYNSVRTAFPSHSDCFCHILTGRSRHLACKAADTPNACTLLFLVTWLSLAIP